MAARHKMSTFKFQVPLLRKIYLLIVLNYIQEHLVVEAKVFVFVGKTQLLIQAADALMGGWCKKSFVASGIKSFFNVMACMI